MIYKTIIKLRWLVVMAFLVSSVALSAPAAATGSNIITVHPALWMVKNSHNKTGGKIYLLGSFHLLPKNYRWYNGIIARSFTASDQVVLETDITPGSMAEIQRLIAKNAFFGPKDSLQNHLDGAHYRKLLNRAARLLKMNSSAVNRSKPWFIALRLSIAAIISSGLDPSSGVDKYIKDRALKVGKPVYGFETPRQQMLALINHPLDVQVSMLTDTLDKLDNFKRYIASYLKAWASGDPATMVKTMVDDMAKNKAMYQALLVRRNNNWFPAIEGYLNSPKITFVVVGAAHLVGPDGLIKMLRDNGYKIVKIQ
ncbi:MAG: TraB/GumN family protein [Alphaproteobacteria bacterium]|nr:TraB/GumN family protein [Alphaproteobacteria bacterium]